MTNDLVKRLRTYDWDTQDGAIRTLHEAADRIEALEKALHSISLGAQNSMTCKEDLGALARRALEAK